MLLAILLDTCIVIDFLGGSLSARSRKLIENHKQQTFVSLASLWEVALKQRLLAERGITSAVVDAFVEDYATWLPVRQAHIHRLVALPDHHRDPYDRLLIAQALVEDLTILTTDRKFSFYHGLKLRMS
jgi:PIN domain nuclease of toxin-antitoxin system